MTELGSAPVPEPADDDHRRAAVSGAAVSGTRVSGTRVSGTGVSGTGVSGTGVSGTGVSGTGADAPLAIVYADFECPFCAALHLRLARLPVSVIFRHFPVRSSHPRAWPAACAAEAAGLQGRFWEMHDSLFADQARLEDPHLWDRAERLGLDLNRFDADRRREGVRERVQRDFRSGVRAGVVTTPTLFVWEDGAALRVEIGELEKRLV